MQNKTLTKESLNGKHYNDKKNKLTSIWGILQKYLIYNVCMGLPMSFCNISFSVGYPELGWGRGGATYGNGMAYVVREYGKCHIHHLLIYYFFSGM